MEFPVNVSLFPESPSPTYDHAAGIKEGENGKRMEGRKKKKKKEKRKEKKNNNTNELKEVLLPLHSPDAS